MIITAVVQYNGNTLVVDLPRDRMDLEVKLHSIGIQILSDNPAAHSFVKLPGIVIFGDTMTNE